jgi:septal ring factor EnvC (AmiA/AmiB activator)
LRYPVLGSPTREPQRKRRNRVERGRGGEEAFGELTQNLLDNPLFSQALVAALGAGERALQAQRSAMTALHIPSADDVERLERRLRSVSDRLEDVEDRLDELSLELSGLRGQLRRNAADQKPAPTPGPGERAGAS